MKVIFKWVTPQNKLRISRRRGNKREEKKRSRSTTSFPAMIQEMGTKPASFLAMTNQITEKKMK
jgi:hypothetical protein